MHSKHLSPTQELRAVVYTKTSKGRAELELGLIAPQTTAAPPAVPKPASTLVITTADTASMLRIQAMMIESAEAFPGLMAADLVRRIQRTDDEAQLLSVLGHWHMAMCQSKYGRAVAGELLAEIKARFGPETSSPANSAMN
ncbi:hypothetical protein HSX11_14790 [Oxalobacteraceae bacterium]|nr:hypothetical protein [Oxalobacteraceae bacterium]